MQRYVTQISGDRIQVTSQDTPVPFAGPQQLLVRVQAAGLNRGEILALRQSPADTPASLGIEAAGEIVAVGAGSGVFQAGQRIMGRCKNAFADYALLDARDAMPIPDALSWEQAAAIPITTMVVYDMLVVQGRLTADEWLLIAGISSGVGVAALQLAKMLGARVIGTSGSPDKLAALADHGLDLGIPTRSPDFHAAVMNATGDRGADLAVNVVGGSVLAECVHSLAFQGRLAIVGHVDGVRSGPLDLGALHGQRLQLFGVSSKGLNAAQRQRIVQGVVNEVLPAIAGGRMSPLIDQVFPFDQLEAAIARMESNAQLGKIVVTHHPAG
ncbi:quinone oxidoreductase family protein [Castellaniella sp.]|uniref:quinone oxidoreductase family protein n=1 Tax=Castellaniella sp. TaxID=1955812 RepID=UPI002AFE3E50|nr:zinc-binding dehydrogenase [Castellaniella sp.]